MMPRVQVAVVLCKNGLGHTKRTGRIVNELLKREHNINVTVICSSQQRDYLEKWEDSSMFARKENVHWMEFDTLIDLKFISLGQNKAAEIMKYFGTLGLKKYDLVLSDNLVEPLFFNRRTIIIGSFLWHDIYPETKNDYCRRCEEILHVVEPQCIVNKYFAMPVFETIKNTNGVGFIPFSAKRESHLIGRDVLVQIGNTAHAVRVVKRLLKHCSDNMDTMNARCLIVDKKLRDFGYNPLIKYVDYGKVCFDDIYFSISRPGLGSITDMITTLTPMMILKFKNIELDFNLRKCEELGIGVRYSFDRFISYLAEGEDHKELLRMKKNINHLDTYGLEQALAVIKNHLN